MEDQYRKQSEITNSQLAAKNSGAAIMVKNLGLIGEQVLALQKTELFRRKPRPAQVGIEEEYRDEASSMGYSFKDTLLLDSSAPLRLESVLNFMGSKSSTPREHPRVLLASTGSIEDSARTPLESPKETNMITSSPRKLFLSPSNLNYQSQNTDMQIMHASTTQIQKSVNSPQVATANKVTTTKGLTPEKTPPTNPFVNPKMQVSLKKRVWMEIIPKTSNPNNLKRGNSGEALGLPKQLTSTTNSSGNVAWKNPTAQPMKNIKNSLKPAAEKQQPVNQKDSQKISRLLRTPTSVEHRIKAKEQTQKSPDIEIGDQKGYSPDQGANKPRLRLSKSMRIDLSAEEQKLSMQSSMLGSTLQFPSQGLSKVEPELTSKSPIVPALKNVGSNNLQKIPEEPPLPQSARRSSKKKAVEGLSLREMMLQKEKQEILHSMMKRRQISPAPPAKTNFGCWAFQQLKEQKERQGVKNLPSQKTAMMEYFTDKDSNIKRPMLDSNTAAAKVSKASTLRSELMKTDRAHSGKPTVRTSSRPSQPQKKPSRV